MKHHFRHFVRPILGISFAGMMTLVSALLFLPLPAQAAQSTEKVAAVHHQVVLADSLNGTTIVIMLVICILLGLFIGWAMASSERSRMNTVHIQKQARSYVDLKNVNLTNKNDLFLFRVTSTNAANTVNNVANAASGIGSQMPLNPYQGSSGRVQGGSRPGQVNFKVNQKPPQNRPVQNRPAQGRPVQSRPPQGRTPQNRPQNGGFMKNNGPKQSGQK